MRLLGLGAIGPSSFNNSADGSRFSADLWYALIDAMVAANLSLECIMYGVSWPADDQVPPQYINYFAGFESGADVEGFEALSVRGGNYFDFRCEVPATELDTGFREAYLVAMPKSGLTPREGQHLEVYGDEYDPSAEIARFRILIPVS